MMYRLTMSLNSFGRRGGGVATSNVVGWFPVVHGYAAADAVDGRGDTGTVAVNLSGRGVVAEDARAFVLSCLFGSCPVFVPLFLYNPQFAGKETSFSIKSSSLKLMTSLLIATIAYSGIIRLLVSTGSPGEGLPGLLKS